MNPARIVRPLCLLFSVVLALQSISFLVQQADQSTLLRALEEKSLANEGKVHNTGSDFSVSVEATALDDEGTADTGLRMDGFAIVDTDETPSARRREVFIIPDRRSKVKPVRLDDLTSPSRSDDVANVREPATVPDELQSKKQGQKQEEVPQSNVSKTKQRSSQRKRDPALEEATKPDHSLPTFALERKLHLGFRNGCTAFTTLVMQGLERNVSQILLPSISFKDHGGSGKRIEFENLFDVVHWNSHYPSLPRLVSFDPKLHSQWNESARRFIQVANENYTRPFALLGGELQHLEYHSNYTAQLEYQAANMGERNAAELKILRGALRPHPDIQKHINGIIKRANERDHDNAEITNDYMVLHARVEPDMQRTRRCVWAKVKRLSTILEMLERQYPVPPAPKLLIAMNRDLLEESARKNNNTVAAKNLQTLNRALKDGLWNGTVQVEEAGVSSLKRTSFRRRPGVVGSLVDFFLAVNAKVFVGTEISRFSMDVITTRFYNAQKANYLYLPRGIKHATPEEAERPPRFKC